MCLSVGCATRAYGILCLRLCCIHEMCVQEKVLCVLCIHEFLGVNVERIEASGMR